MKFGGNSTDIAYQVFSPALGLVCDVPTMLVREHSHRRWKVLVHKRCTRIRCVLIVSGIVVEQELIDHRDVLIGFFVVGQMTAFFEPDELHSGDGGGAPER